MFAGLHAKIIVKQLPGRMLGAEFRPRICENDEILEEHNLDVLKNATGHHLFDHHAINSDLHRLKSCVKSHMLPISSSAQHMESEIKNASSCKEIGRGEITTAHLHNARCQLASDISKITETNTECMNQKKNPEKEEINCIPDRHFYRSVLNH